MIAEALFIALFEVDIHDKMAGVGVSSFRHGKGAVVEAMLYVVLCCRGGMESLYRL
jgi:hypothetical protein